ncbi:phosphoethanolamine transferase [Thalassotalea profundi]|uniref:Phosphoethanolamine transferase n=1 Tax=Thalassotalea profundi TaxID=2036687 RepID=A0ABQ3IRT0_9GAMM|nr:phosphoethanolamine--lipid A transferase [Thalassotalea profundi]GHE92442.1 phosphoethanolamine transferase [Thalassotalea profundi]
MIRTIPFIKNLKLTTNQLVIYTCLYITFIVNIPFLTKTVTVITALDQYNGLFLISVPFFLLSLSIIVQSFFAFRWITKPFLILVVLLSSILFYATINYGIVFDYGMIQNTVETDTAEAFSYFNLSAIFFFLFFGVVPSILIAKVQLTYNSFIGELFARLKLISGSIGVLLLIAMVFYSSYASVGRNNRDLVGYLTPYALIDSTAKYIRKNYLYPPLKFSLLDTKPEIVKPTQNKHVTVMVLGETARAQNFSLNGYDKPTNQYTDKLNVVSFANVSSCGTATAVSVPCMFSRLNKESYDKRIASSQQNAIDIIHLAGADVLWVSNNNGSCKGVCNRVKTIKIATKKTSPLCDGEYCFDEALLPPLRKKLTSLTHENTLIVLHMIGSHGPTYYRRYPEKNRIFTPDCQRSDIQNCTQNELVNTYDNTIAYTDYVLSRVIDELNSLSELNDVETSMLYISDHGESLGESGVFLHGLPYAFAPREQTHVPFIYWSDSLHLKGRADCVKNVSDLNISHDNIFDILLNEMSVKSDTYKEQNNPLNQCKLSSLTAQSAYQPTSIGAK